jgi:5'(3')-deoxyribonucleotidase
MNDIDNVALVDMDGTLCDFRGQLDHDLKRVLGDDLAKVEPSTLQQVEYLIRGQAGWYRNLKPLPLGFEIVRILQDIGFRIMILTKSSKESKNAWSEKVAWIAEHLPEVDVTVTQDKGLVYGKVLVDDYPSHFLRWMERRPRGLVLMPVQPWNRDTSKRVNLHAVSCRADLDGIRPTLEEAYERGREQRGNAR